MVLQLTILRYWKTFSIFLVIFVISAVPGQAIPDVPILNFDKLVHGYAYFLLPIVFFNDVKRYGHLKQPKSILVIVVTVSMVYGGLLEVLQAFVFINRSGNWIDFWANSIGIACAAVFIQTIHWLSHSCKF